MPLQNFDNFIQRCGTSRTPKLLAVVVLPAAYFFIWPCIKRKMPTFFHKGSFEKTNTELMLLNMHKGPVGVLPESNVPHVGGREFVRQGSASKEEAHPMKRMKRIGSENGICKVQVNDAMT